MATPTTQTAAPDFTQNDSIAQAYAPVTSFLQNQATQTSKRYADNAANIKSIFGTLSTVRQEDIPRIQKQFATSLLEQQTAVADRMARQNAEASAGRQGAATAASELGSGGMPTPTSSMSGGAYTASNTDANAYQTTWNALQNVMSSQQQANVDAQIQGYDYQRVATLENLQKSLEDKLMQISGNQAQVLTDIANAKNSAAAAANEQGLEYGSLQDKLANALAVAKVRAKGTTDAATIRAGARTGSNTPTPPPVEDTKSRKNFSNNVLGWEDWAKANGADAGAVGSMRKNAEYALNAWKTDPKNANKTPTRTQILQKWNELYGKSGRGASKDYVAEYITKYLSLK
jgi:hypothetical protein